MFFDFGRFFGDPDPGTEDLWWRHVPFFVPTLVIVTVTFLIGRALIQKNKSDD